jgi:hypothetical protein
MATFNATSEYAGQQVWYRHNDPGWHKTDFEIEGSGYVEAIFLIERDQYGQLDWVSEEDHQRIYHYAQMDPAQAPATRLIDATTPPKPAGVAAATQGSAVGAPPGPGEIHGMPVYKRPVFIVFAVLGVFVLCSCCGSTFFWLGV